jgi:vancomycin resistance protein YoaR
VSIAEVVREVVTTRMPGQWLRRVVTGASVIVAGAVLVSVAAIFAYGWLQGDRIYPGVRVAGVDVGGLTVDEAAQRVTNALAALTNQEIVLTFQGAELALPVRELEPEWNAQVAVNQAHRVGRSGNLWRDSASWLAARLGLEVIPVPVTYRADRLEAAVRTLAERAARPPQDAFFTVDEDGSLYVAPAREGVGIDLGIARQSVEGALASGRVGRVELAPVTLPPTYTESDLEPLKPRVQALVGSPIVLTLDGESRWMISPPDLARLLTLTSHEGALRASFDRGKLEEYLSRIAGVVVAPAQDAHVRWNGSAFEVVPARPGAVLDVVATVNEFLVRVERGERTIPVQARPASPLVTEAMADEARARAQALVDRGLTVRWPNGTRTLRGGELAALLTFEQRRQGENVVGLDVSIDRSTVRSLLEAIAPQIQRDARDAVLRYRDGKVIVVTPEQTGQRLDIEGSLIAFEQAVRSGRSAVDLVVANVEPRVTSAVASQIRIRERISAGATYYGDSAPNRRHNVELAVQRVNGALVPPGEVFSFTGTVGAINLENGYKVGYGIVATNGRVQTVPSVGGGVCQVSTTVFHAAFWGGFPIVERNWHLYWIPLYGQPPSGLIGLDATVDTDYGLDFKFRNTTSDWIAVVAWADGSWVHVEIWGTKPNWRVVVDDPVVTNVVKADPTPVIREDSSLAPGEQVVVERARDGFSVAIRRRVYEGDRLIDDVTLRSTYQPSQNVTLVGPQPSPTPTETPEEGTPQPTEATTPVPEATPTPVP